MRRLLGCLAATLLIQIIFVMPLWSKDRNTVAVLPFSTHSAEDIDYIRNGISDMIASRVSISDKIDVIAKDLVLAEVGSDEKKELTANDIYAVGKKLSADFIVWGSITKIGKSLSIDGKLADVNLSKTAIDFFAQCPTMDEVIPKINDFTQKIGEHIVGIASNPQQTNNNSSLLKGNVTARPSSAQSVREAEIISGIKNGKKGTFTSTINPDFINAAEPLNRNTFWKSQQYPYEFKGVDIGDVNGDGLNETIIIDSYNIYIFRKIGKEFRLIHRIPGKVHDRYVSLDVADINSNGVKEIIVSSYTGQQVNSFIVEFQTGKYETIASNLPFFMRVIDNGSKERPLLLGQRRGMDKPFETSIYEIVWMNGKYQEAHKMRIPQGLSVYGLTLAKLGAGDTERIVSLNDYDYVCVYEKTDKPLSKIAVVGGSNEFIWKSEEIFGGSNTVIESMRGSIVDNDEPYNYINLRILAYDTNEDGKKEVIIVKNLSSSGRMFQRVKMFTSAEVYNLEWDGSGLIENWRTKKISGYVADYQFKDIDNDGDNEIVLALVLSVGGTIRERSVIVTYELRGE